MSRIHCYICHKTGYEISVSNKGFLEPETCFLGYFLRPKTLILTVKEFLAMKNILNSSQTNA